MPSYMLQVLLHPTQRTGPGIAPPLRITHAPQQLMYPGPFLGDQQSNFQTVLLLGCCVTTSCQLHYIALWLMRSTCALQEVLQHLALAPAQTLPPHLAVGALGGLLVAPVTTPTHFSLLPSLLVPVGLASSHLPLQALVPQTQQVTPCLTSVRLQHTRCKEHERFAQWLPLHLSDTVPDIHS